MARAYVGMAGALALLLTLPAGAQAQSGGWWSWALPLVQQGAQAGLRDADTRWEDARRDRDDDRWDDRRGDRDDDRWNDRRRDDRGRDRARGQQRAERGPPFCRNGQGHPVHGRRWCQDKGFGQGSVWERARWEDVIFGDGRGSRQRDVL
ncbi:MAG TPA: hypothetical protein VMK65_02465, partial [Longimicrobiales bacterium]|nr:hypothetical protein [Longimicrobiales bacterium]